MPGPIVETKAGRIRGKALPAGAAFLGIPYAAPPVGELRFRPPVPAAGWDGVRDATAYGPTPPKNPQVPPFDTLIPDPSIDGADHLNLNVWTPDPGGAGLPVYVWIHGGAFVSGSGALEIYDGSAFARDGVVCVTLNYRLGVDGFAHLPGAPDNRGLLDQLAALEWVAENIAAFGGDPDKVTIGGESAGGMSVTSLLSAPRASGLFRGVIAQSGAGYHAITTEAAERVTAALAEKLGVEPAAASVAAVPIETLLAAQAAVGLEVQSGGRERWGEVAANMMAFEPVVDGDVLPVLPGEALGSAKPSVRLLVGTNTDEMRLFLVPSGVADLVDDGLLATMTADRGLDEAGLAAYVAARPGASPGDVLCDAVSDWFFRVPAIRAAEVRPAGSAWLYEFAWRSPVMDGRLGACHGLEVPFTFDTLGREGGSWMAGDGAPAGLAEAVHGAWVRFITDGDPGWPAYDLERRPTMVFDAGRTDVVDDLRGDERRLWEGRR